MYTASSRCLILDHQKLLAEQLLPFDVDVDVAAAAVLVALV